MEKEIEKEHRTTVVRFSKRNYEIDINAAVDFLERLKSLNNEKYEYISNEKLIQDIKDYDLWDRLFIEAIGTRSRKRRKV